MDVSRRDFGAASLGAVAATLLPKSEAKGNTIKIKDREFTFAERIFVKRLQPGECGWIHWNAVGIDNEKTLLYVATAAPVLPNREGIEEVLRFVVAFDGKDYYLDATEDQKVRYEHLDPEKVTSDYVTGFKFAPKEALTPQGLDYAYFGGSSLSQGTIEIPPANLVY